MVVIRLARYGRLKLPFYKIIVADRRKFRNCKFIEKIGFYNPFLDFKNNIGIFININLLNNWIKKGVVISKRVNFLIKKYIKLKIC